MLKIIFDMLCLWTIIVIVTDMTDWPKTVKNAISKILTKGKVTILRMHLIDCSLCLTTWVLLAYLLLTSSFTLPLFAFAMILALFSSLLSEIFFLLKDLVSFGITKIKRLLKK